jgi:hypothetical protein
MSGHGHVDASNKRVALVISVLALFLALAETMGKSSQTNALQANVEAANLWAFFQAKTIRMTTLRAAGEAAEVDAVAAGDASAPESAPAVARSKRIDEWRRTAARWDSEPETGEGRRELAARAKAAEERSALAMARYHHYEVASAAFQIGIVLASATVITGAAALTLLALGLGVVGLAFTGIGLLAPHAVHLF